MRNPIETLLGGVIFIFAVVVLVAGYMKADVRQINGYEVRVVFSKAGGIMTGNDVKINGIKVGSVSEVTLDNDFNAVIRLNVRYDVKLPVDTVASISSEGIVGDKYVNLDPGTSDKLVAQNNKGELRKIKNYKSLEDMVSDVIFSMGGADAK